MCVYMIEIVGLHKGRKLSSSNRCAGKKCEQVFSLEQGGLLHFSTPIPVFVHDAVAAVGIPSWHLVIVLVIDNILERTCDISLLSVV